MPSHIKTLLSSFIRSQQGWKFKLLKEWNTLMGPLANNVTLEKVYNDKVVLGVSDSCWLQELYLLSSTILQTINESLDEPHIKHLHFKQVPKKKSKKKHETVIYETKRAQHPTLNRSEKMALTRVTDPHLKQALESFLIRCQQEAKR